MTTEILKKHGWQVEAVRKAYAQFTILDFFGALKSLELTDRERTLKLARAMFNRTPMSSREPIKSIAELAATTDQELQLPRGAGQQFLGQINAALISLLSK